MLSLWAMLLLMLLLLGLCGRGVVESAGSELATDVGSVQKKSSKLFGPTLNQSQPQQNLLPLPPSLQMPTSIWLHHSCIHMN